MSKTIDGKAKMDSDTFKPMLAKIEDEHFSKEKIDILKNPREGVYYSGKQVTKIIAEFTHSSDKIKALEIVVQNGVAISCKKTKLLLESITFSSDQLKAIELLANCIKDPEKKADIVEVFNFHFDRKKAEDILEL